jgi:hypothetical protein
LSSDFLLFPHDILIPTFLYGKLLNEWKCGTAAAHVIERHIEKTEQVAAASTKLSNLHSLITWFTS